MMSRYLAAMLIYLFGVDAMATESPDYEVLHGTDAYEIRRYSPYVVAEVDVPGTVGDSSNDAFRILAGYIFGGNRSGERMGMTTPVESRPAKEGTTMAMTTPVISSTDSTSPGSVTYAFVMERKYDIESLPEPNDSRIRFREVESGTVAALRYSGRWTESNYQRHRAELLRALAKDGVSHVGEPMSARYNAPFVPPFARRNEVIVPIDWSDEQ